MEQIRNFMSIMQKFKMACGNLVLSQLIGFKLGCPVKHTSIKHPVLRHVVGSSKYSLALLFFVRHLFLQDDHGIDDGIFHDLALGGGVDKDVPDTSTI